ncbi:hypothetical protein [Mycobacterium sp. 1274761.0]|uniref:hypothetical protein n=1 Tax=Mycobacterium sp. 1274761.0 TaxID=1834077 RepID=UPI000A85882F|nr:hypothetical protein [Mycobacterium sp. 1274761.0]
MHRTLVTRFATAAAVSVGLMVAGLGLAAAPAQAEACSPWNAKTPPCAPPEGPPGTCDANGVCGQLWCPGSGMRNVPNWDMNVCHTFYFDRNAPLTEPVMIPGQPPGPPPPPPPPCIPFVTCLPGF